MARIIWTQPAIADLQAVAEYIELDNPSAASRLVKKIFKRIESLADFPKLGKIPKELPGLSYLEIVVVPCRIFYRIDRNTIYIVAVYRMERGEIILP